MTLSRRDFSRLALLAGASTLLPRAARGSSYWAEKSPLPGTPRSLPARLFPSDNWWNLDISAAPADRNSAALMAPFVGNSLSTNWGAWAGQPFCTVSGDHPAVSFDKITIADESDREPFPIPERAFFERGWTEYGGSNSRSPAINEPLAPGADRHLIIVDVDNNRLFEVYQPYRNITCEPVQIGSVTVLPGQLYCYSCAIWDMNGNNVRPADWTSTDAAGLQILPGLVQYDEMVGAAPVGHAHRMTLNVTAPRYVWPARHQAGNGGLIPMGARMRLKASVNPPGLEAYPSARKMLEALHVHGVIIADNVPTGMISGSLDSRWGPEDDSNAMVGLVFLLGQKLRLGRDFELIELGYGMPCAVP